MGVRAEEPEMKVLLALTFLLAFLALGLSEPDTDRDLELLRDKREPARRDKKETAGGNKRKSGKGKGRSAKKGKDRKKKSTKKSSRKIKPNKKNSNGKN